LDGVAPYVKMGRPILVCFTFFFLDLTSWFIYTRGELRFQRKSL